MARTVVTDPNFRVSRQVALACQSIDILDYYLTASLYDPTSSLGKFVEALPSFLHRRLVRQLKKRESPGLAPDRIRAMLVFEMYMYLARRYSRLVGPSHSHKLTGWGDRFFDLVAARSLPQGTQFVYANEGSALHTLRRGQQLGAITILEGTQHPRFLESVLEPEYKRLGLKFPVEYFRTSLVMQELQFADYVLTQSDFAAQTFEGRVPSRTKIVTIPLGVDQHLFHPKTERLYPRIRETLELLYVGQLSVRKGTARLLEVIRNLNRLNLRLTIVGSMTADFRPIWDQLHPSVKHRVIWKGTVPRQELPDVYRQADVFILPTLCDSFGLVVLEAMACGTPVIVTDACGAPVRNAMDGLIVGSTDMNSLSSAIESCYQNRDQLVEWGQNAALRAGEYTWERFRASISSLFSSAVESEPDDPTIHRRSYRS